MDFEMLLDDRWFFLAQIIQIYYAFGLGLMLRSYTFINHIFILWQFTTHIYATNWLFRLTKGTVSSFSLMDKFLWSAFVDLYTACHASCALSEFGYLLCLIVKLIFTKFMW